MDLTNNRNIKFIFNSEFESGNLDTVIQRSECEFDLYLRSDTNASILHSWFYFSIQNYRKESIKLNIKNLNQSYYFYNQGMKISVLSIKKQNLALEGKLPDRFKTWNKEGENISYNRINSKKHFINSNMFFKKGMIYFV